MKLLGNPMTEPTLIGFDQFKDERGYFMETFRKSEFPIDFVQENESLSKAGVIRGLHWQTSPHPQGKLVRCVSGAVYDIAIDIRKGSPEFGKVNGVYLDSRFSPQAFYIPVGFAHGFISLFDNTKVVYKCTDYWSKECERGLNPLDPTLNIDWNFIYKFATEKDLEGLTLSDKDKVLPKLSEIEPIDIGDDI